MMVWTTLSLMEQEKMVWLFSAVKVLEIRSKVAFVTLMESMLSLWEAMFKRGRGGSSQKLCRMWVTMSVTTS